MSVKFEAGLNIAIKIPMSKYEQTVAFYRNILLFDTEEIPIDNPTVSRTHRVRFGELTLWLDRVDNYARSEVWMQVTVPDIQQARNYLEVNGIETCDELETLGENMHWILDPTGTVFNLQQAVSDE